MNHKGRRQPGPLDEATEQQMEIVSLAHRIIECAKRANAVTDPMAFEQRKTA